MNILTKVDLEELLLIGILVAQILVWLRLPKQIDTQKRRKRQKRIDKIHGAIYTRVKGWRK